MEAATPHPVLGRVLDDLQANEGVALGRLFDWLRIPSIPTQEGHAADCRRAAEWFRAQLRMIGFTAEVHPTAGRPVVVGHSAEAGPEAPTILRHGHYDVQPADPAAL